MRLLALISTLATTVFLPSAHRTQAQHAPLHQVHITAHGISLRLSVPRASYPQDALVEVTVTLRNVSHHKVWLMGGGPPASGKSFPQVEVLEPKGDIVFPPAVTEVLPYLGPGPTWVKVAVHGMLLERVYVVLRGPEVRATVTVIKNHRFMTVAGQVTTPALQLHLTAADAPQIHLDVSSGQVKAIITPSSSIQGEPLYQDAASCGDTVVAQHLDWTRTGTVLLPGCAMPQIWHVVAGWPNHSIATLDYLSGGTPTPRNGNLSLSAIQTRTQ